MCAHSAIWLHCFAAVNHGQWVHTLCLLCPGAVWGHWREILPLNQSMLLWCNFQSASWLVLHCTCRNWWFDSFSLGNRAWFHVLHCLCVPPHTSLCWGFLVDMLSIFCCTSNVALCDHVLDSWRCNVAEFLVGFTNGQLDHHNACIVDGGGILWCCYMVGTIGMWSCRHGGTAWIMDGAYATAECCKAFCIVKPAYQDESKCHIRGMYCLLEYDLGALCTIW